MLSQAQMGGAAMSASKQAMPETQKFDGPSGIATSGVEDKFAAHSNMPLAKPGFNS
jgi:hypothetical protein